MKQAISKAGAKCYVWEQQCAGWHLLKSHALSVIQGHVSDEGASTEAGG